MVSAPVVQAGAVATVHPRRQSLKKRFVPALLATLVAAGIFGVEPVKIGSDSMAPTLVAGQHVVLDKLSYHLRSPRRDELVVFHAPYTGDLTLKRVVAVGGDTVAIRDGVLYVNSHAPSEPYVDRGDVDSVYYGPTKVPANELFVLGDNRGNSIDSRVFGPVPQDSVVGRVMWIF